MNKTAVVTQEEVRLDAYGGRPEIREMQTRLMAMLPNVKKLGQTGAMALAQAALAMGLNPFIGEIWAIPQKNGTFTLMPGIKGIRRKAKEQAERDRGYYTVTFRAPTDAEIEGMILNKDDIVRACDVVVVGDRALLIYKLTGQLPKFTGIGCYRAGESTKMEPIQVARKRAEADALKQAFDIPLPVASTGLPDPHPDWDEFNVEAMPDVPEQYLEGYYDNHVIEGNATEAIADLYGDEFSGNDEAPKQRVGKDPAELIAKGKAAMAQEPVEMPADVDDGGKPKNGNGRSWPSDTIQAVVPKYAENPAHAVQMLNLSEKLTPKDAPDIVIQWCEFYRGARAVGDEPEVAATYADGKLELPQAEPA